MFRFLVVTWSPSHAQACGAAKLLLQRIGASRTEWELTFKTSGLVAFQTGASEGRGSVTLAGESGVILGEIFTGGDISNSQRIRSSFDERCTEQIVNSRGQHLVDRYWGAYVGFIRSGAGEDVHTVCAPANVLPCLFMKFSGTTVFFSRTEDCVEFAPMQISFNWDFLVRFILNRGDRYIHGTGLHDVSRVFPGECVSISGGVLARKLYWDPVKIAGAEPIEDEKVAVEAIKGTTQGCVSAWASRHERIVLKLSGGLDSSIVLHCLTRVPGRPEIECLNVVTPGDQGDEREFARLVASAKTIPLHEMLRDIRTMRIDTGARIERTALPSNFLGLLFQVGVESDFAKTHGASAYFKGDLGDELFLRSGMKYMAADHVWHHWISRRLFRVAYSEARVCQRTIWSVLWDAVVGRRRSQGLPFYSDLLNNSPYLSKDALSTVTPSSLLPAVVRDLESLPPGKRAHLLLCFPPLTYYDPLGDMDQPDYVAPFNSQPLLELCFRIPTFVLNSGGVGRALAREAFSKDIPPEIIRRRTKGTSSSMYLEAFRNNHDVLRDVLLDGVLVREGVVDRRRLEHSLSSREALTVYQKSHIPVLYSTEVWLQNWEGIQRAKYAVA